MRLRTMRRSREDAQVDLTPMLDIVFIMLIFFVVTSSFVREAGVEVNRPSASQSEQQENTKVSVAINADNEVYIDQQFVDVGLLEQRFAEIKPELEDALLMIVADKHAYNGTVIQVMDAAKSVGIESIALAAERR